MPIINLNEKKRVKQLKPLVTIQKEAVRFNEFFINELKQKLKIQTIFNNVFVQIDIDTDNFAILFTFFNNNENSELFLNKLSKNYVVRNRPLFRYDWIKTSFINNINSNQWDLTNIDKLTWECRLLPVASLRINKNEINQLSDSTKGFYELYDIDDNLVYIGISKSKQGIKSRLSEHLKFIEFNYIKYAIISDISKLREYENQLLNNYHNKYGRLPYYNKQK